MTGTVPYEDRRKTAEALYEQYGKSDRGKTIIGKTLTEVMANAIEAFGNGQFVFKIGSRAVGSFR